MKGEFSGKTDTRPVKRCDWCLRDESYISYHDREWGVPVKDDRKIFEFIVLESAQAGLSWLTILKRREFYRQAFAGFDIEKVAGFTEREVERLLLGSGIIRNRAKIRAAIVNARSALKIISLHGSLAEYFWSFTDGRTINGNWRSVSEIPASTDLSRKLSADLKKMGFVFFGPVIAYAHMQATGMVNDHLAGCFRFHEIRQLSGSE